MSDRGGLTMVEVLVALALLALQAPMLAGALGLAVRLTAQAAAVVEAITPAASLALCGAP